jgi:hypothetical protein
MSNSIINLGELSKPATVLIEKISEAVGGVFKPYQVVRVAKAEAEADKIRASAHIEVEDLQRRALHRFLLEEGTKQQNMEAITAKALPLLGEGAEPQNLEKDWLTNFFDKCRLVSDTEMQDLWSRVLTGEATAPGTFSKRTVNFLGSLDKIEASLFTKLCSFCCSSGGVIAVVFDVSDTVYTDNGINFGSLTHLESIGLVRFDNLAGFRRIHLPKHLRLHYYGEPLDLHFPADSENELPLGKVLLTKLAAELAPICGSQPEPAFLVYLKERWKTFLQAAPLDTVQGSELKANSSEPTPAG